MALEPKLVRTARLIPLPLVRSGKISETISQLIGPNDIWDFENKIIRTNLTFFLWTKSILWGLRWLCFNFFFFFFSFFWKEL
jgi:hypothetical protein